MKMLLATFLISILAFSIASMDLVLSIVYLIRIKRGFVNHFVVFSAVLLASVFFLLMGSFSEITFDGITRNVLYYIWDVLLILVATFLFNYIPFVVTIIIAHPWRNPYKTIFFLTSVIYITSAIAGYFYPTLLFNNIRFLCFFFIVFFCITVVLKNYNTISIRHVKKTLLAMAIISFCLIPLIILSLFFDSLKDITTPVLLFSSTVCILVYLFIDITKVEKMNESKKEKKQLSVSCLSHYRVSEREFDVILLIKEGLTNKEIGERLKISVNTVNNHIANIFSKTSVRSRIDLLNLLEDITNV